MIIKSLIKNAAIGVAILFTLNQVATADGVDDSKANASPLKGIPSGSYELDVTHASIVWKVSHFGFSTYVGRFNDFTADLDLNSNDFSKSAVSVDIKVDSIDTAYPFPEKEDFDKKLSNDWFNSPDAPTISFKSTEVSALDGSNFTIKGDMTMSGQTHPVTFNAKINGATPTHPFMKKPVVGFSATTTLDRTTWGVSKYAPNIGAEVQVEIETEFLKAD